MNHKACSGNLLSYIVNNLKQLQSLELTGTGFDEVSTEELERVDFGLLKSLRWLDLSGSKNCNKIVSKILQRCESLKRLDISSCKELTDDMFKVNRIVSPIEELNISFLNV
jgi:Leucine-rich repeat (LRR) protein